MAAPVQRPAPDGSSDRLERGWASRGAERDAQSPRIFCSPPRPEHVAEKVEPKTRVIVASALILAVDDFRLLGMQRQSAASKSSLKLVQVYVMGSEVCTISERSHGFRIGKGYLATIYVREADDWKIRMAYVN